jgi:Tfp pilus assembly protein FimT
MSRIVIGTLRVPSPAHGTRSVPATKRRRGKTLVEAMVIITLVTLIAAGSATTLIALFRVERQLARDAEARQSAARLASQFRADVHAAIACEAGQTCLLTLADDKTIRYSAKDGWLWRERLKEDAIEHREAFVLHRGSIPGFAVQLMEERQSVRLSISMDAAQPDEQPRPQPTVVVALLNLHGAAVKENEQ